ncbi:MAG: hypothetical protein ACRDRO_04405 [Pseudonocardiaceae bacterium]
MPRPDVVIVRVKGTVDVLTAPGWPSGWLSSSPEHRTSLDLDEVSVLGPQDLLMLHQQALACGMQLHTVGVERDALRRPLHARVWPIS